MPIIDKMNKLEQITKDEQEKGAARLDELGIHNVGNTVQDVMENIPRSGGGSGFEVQADWNQDDSEAPDYIKNKPEIPPFPQLSVLPEATTVPEGTIVQYTGETMENGYHHGWFYETKRMPGEPPRYRSWRNIQVDDLDAKQDNIYVSPALMLSVDGWDAETLKQTVYLPPRVMETRFKTTFDMSPESADRWAKAHIIISEYTVYNDGVKRKQYWEAFEFKCESIPTDDITFVLTSFNAQNDSGLFLPYLPNADVSGKQNIVLDTPLNIGGVSKTTVEDALAALNSVKLEDVDSTPTSGSNNPVSSDGIYQALDAKEDKLTFDTTPTSGSNNPVSSDGIYSAIQSAAGGIVINTWSPASITTTASSKSFTDASKTKFIIINGRDSSASDNYTYTPIIISTTMLSTSDYKSFNTQKGSSTMTIQVKKNSTVGFSVKTASGTFYPDIVFVY